MEFKYGNKFHKLYVESAVKNALNRPHPADMENKNAAYFFIWQNCSKLIEAAYLAGAKGNSKPSSIVPSTEPTAGEHGLAARR